MGPQVTRGQAQRYVAVERVYKFPDGGTYLGSQPIEEAERALDEAASAAYVDMKRRELDAAIENHLMHYGFDVDREVNA